MIDAVRGCWFGVCEGAELVADAGVFWRDGIGRFQNVETHPAHRRQGICGTLVHNASMHALNHPDVNRAVMEANEGRGAARIYESLNFDPVE